MTRPSAQTLERERESDKQYVTDAELIRWFGVPERTARAVIRELESKAGFPRKQAMFGNRRHLPSVKAYLDRMNGLNIKPRNDRD